jgi:hypothetical protein
LNVPTPGAANTGFTLFSSSALSPNFEFKVQHRCEKENDDAGITACRGLQALYEGDIATPEDSNGSSQPPPPIESRQSPVFAKATQRKGRKNIMKSKNHRFRFYLFLGAITFFLAFLVNAFLTEKIYADSHSIAGPKSFAALVNKVSDSVVNISAGGKV